MQDAPRMNWKRVLVPHDFSTCADRAEALAIELAEVFGASIVLLHVADGPTGLEANAVIQPEGSDRPVTLGKFVTDGAASRLEQRAQRLRLKGLDVATIVANGDVAETILEHAVEAGADAIVMGTHGRTGLVHLLMGSVAEKVVRHASVPVVTVRVDREAMTPLTLKADDEEAVSSPLRRLAV